MNYFELFNDDYIKEQFKIMDSRDEMYNHGLMHALNVVENIEKIGDVLKIDLETLSYLKIAGFLHDIGRIAGDENHYLKGKELVRKYLESKVDKVWLDKILSAIENHHEKVNVDKLSLFDHIVLFADKMDFSYKRLNKDIECFENNILDINFDIVNDAFIVIIKFKNKTTNSDFESWIMYSKIIKRIDEFVNKLGIKWEFKFI